MDMEHKDNYCEMVRDDDYKGKIPEGKHPGKVYSYHDREKPHNEPVFYDQFLKEQCKPKPDVKIGPSVELFWRDCHHLSNSGTHTLYVVVKNPYEHLHLKDVKVILKDLNYKDEHGHDQPVPVLPDGCEAVELRPQHSICFGDLAPCGDNEDGDTASREIVLFTRCAPTDGSFKISAYSCFEVEFSDKHELCFELYKCGC